MQLDLFQDAPRFYHRALEARLPEASAEPELFAASTLSLCRQLREGDNVPAACWVVASLARRALRREFHGDPDYAGPWWLVGAYLDQRLPRIEAAPQTLLEARLERFLRGTGEPPAQFYAGLFLSGHGPLLPHAALTTVRRTLRTLHPEAYAAHMERLAELGPLEGTVGKGA